MGLFHARIYIGALGTRPHLGATRPRVGICLARLDALTSKYNTFSYCQVGASTPKWGRVASVPIYIRVE